MSTVNTVKQTTAKKSTRKKSYATVTEENIKMDNYIPYKIG